MKRHPRLRAHIMYRVGEYLFAIIASFILEKQGNKQKKEIQEKKRHPAFGKNATVLPPCRILGQEINHHKRTFAEIS
jgi:hypothetical protein